MAALTVQNEEPQRRAAGQNAVWERPTMSRCNGGSVVMSTVVESQRKGSTLPGIHFALYDTQSLLTTQLGEATERCQPSLKQGHAGMIMVDCCVYLLSFFAVVIVRRK